MVSFPPCITGARVSSSGRKALGLAFGPFLNVHISTMVSFKLPTRVGLYLCHIHRSKGDCHSGICPPCHQASPCGPSCQVSAPSDCVLPLRQHSPGTSQPCFPPPLTLSLTPSFLQLIMHRVGLESGCTPSCCVAPDMPLRASELQAPQLDIGDDGAGHHSVSRVGNPAGRQ